MKRLLVLSILATVILGLAQAQPAPLPDDARFDEPVEFKTGPEGESLRAMIAALAKAVNLTAIVDEVPDETITYDISDPKPFRQVWDVVLTLRNLDYVMLDNDVVVVGPRASISRLRAGDETDTATSQPGAELVQRFYRVNNDPTEVATIVRRAVPGVDVEVLDSVRSISVLGTQEQQDRVQATLDQFDRAAAEVPLEQRIYKLSNAVATDLAQVLADSLAAEIDAATTAAAQSSEAQPTPAPQLTVVADERTNSLIVTAPAAIQARIAELIPPLDVPQPQVNVQVRIQEIRTTEVSRLGINLTGGIGNFAANILDSGLKFIFDAQNAISGLNIGAVLDTLEEQGLSRRVDDSNITVLNNGTGRINSGGRIELTFAGVDGKINERTIEFGVIVKVTPRIASDGRINLNVVAEVSDVAVPLSEGGIPERIDFDTREVTSTVTLAPGQTVLLGGLLQNSLTSTRNSVPVLGSLPVIGSLFSTSSVEENDTELLLIVTANVIE